ASGASMLHFLLSSRRRHTRFSRDWSSDVCSSDLIFQHFAVNQLLQGADVHFNVLGTEVVVVKTTDRQTTVQRVLTTFEARRYGRSEERRVGKGGWGRGGRGAEDREGPSSGSSGED